MRGWADPLQLGAAVLAMALAGRPELGVGLWSLLAGALLWRALLRASPARAALATLVVFLPIGASGYEGLRNFSPLLLWGGALVLAALYALAPLLLLGLERVAAVRGQRCRAPHAAAPLAAPRRAAHHLLGWCTVDLLLSHALPIPIPFPVTLGYALVHTPWVSLAALGGPPALALSWTLLTLALSTLIPGPTSILSLRRPPLWFSAGILSAVAALLPLAARLTPLDEPVVVQVVQIPEAELAEGGRLAAFLRAAQAANADALAAGGRPAALHLWPEAALGREVPHQAAPLQGAARLLQATVLSGAQRQLSSGAWRNSAVAASPEAARFVLDKRWLVPVYEADFEAGLGERWPLFVGPWRVATLICWESLFFDEARRRTQLGADAVVVLAHDGWARGTLTPRWHALAGRMLAWSLGRPVLVASHEGPSMLWSFDGRRLASGAEGRDAVRAEVAAPRGWTTPYLRWGGGWTLALALAVGIGLGWRPVRVR